MLLCINLNFAQPAVTSENTFWGDVCLTLFRAKLKSDWNDFV